MQISMLICSLPVLSFKGYHISNKQHVTFSGSTPHKTEFQFDVEYTGELFLAKKKVTFSWLVFWDGYGD